ncbi:hypothetical protein OpiT1DRAFT_02328 [Opitutaceae bacterium TAV1]|nr:hypothetical protein OpiT1DRAFT_02328 [Opitutaceae bacterium TAV1]
MRKSGVTHSNGNGPEPSDGIDCIVEPARRVPVAFDAEVCVVGGSCTGVFAAVRAARAGLRVALVEQGVIMGGSATAAQVNEWHSLADARGERRVIGGLTVEVIDRLRRRDAVIETLPGRADTRFRFNSAELATELDELVREHAGIRVFLSARCVAGIRNGRKVTAAVIEDKSGRRAIRAEFFIDASGDGDLLRRSGFAAWQNTRLQPVSYQQLVAGLGALSANFGGKIRNIWTEVRSRAPEFGYPTDNASPWFFDYPAPASADVCNVFGARLNGVDASDADQLTTALTEGRRRQRALLDMIRAVCGKGRGGAGMVTALSHPHAIGVRETWHATCLHRLTADELLSGVDFPDTVAVGTYPVDVHSPKGTLLRYLDGTEKLVALDGSVSERRWRVAENANTPLFYRIPFRSLVPEGAENLLVAGRLLDADREAFGGVRVMVNCNQTGEAAGVATALCLRDGCTPAKLDHRTLRETLFPETLSDLLASEEDKRVVSVGPNGNHRVF